jgi:hypothetical protein
MLPLEAILLWTLSMRLVYEGPFGVVYAAFLSWRRSFVSGKIRSSLEILYKPKASSKSNCSCEVGKICRLGLIIHFFYPVYSCIFSLYSFSLFYVIYKSVGLVQFEHVNNLDRISTLRLTTAETPWIE